MTSSKTIKLIIIFSLFLLLVAFLGWSTALAQQPLEVDYPTLPGAPALGPGTTVPEYILYIFIFSLVIVGITALSLFIYAGILWLTARGGTDQVQKAQKIFVNVFLGVILLLGSFLLFRLLNPELLLLRAPELPSLAIINAPICVPLVPAVGQTTCESRGSAWVDCTQEQANEASCKTNEICCRRLPPGKLGDQCPSDLKPGIPSVNSCEDYISVKKAVNEQGIPANNEDAINWCTNDVCSVGTEQEVCFGFNLAGPKCVALDKTTITSCSSYTGFFLDDSINKKLCQADPAGVGPCKVGSFFKCEEI